MVLQKKILQTIAAVPRAANTRKLTIMGSNGHGMLGGKEGNHTYVETHMGWTPGRRAPPPRAERQRLEESYRIPYLRR